MAVSAWKALKDQIPLCLIIDPQFLPSDINIKILSEPPNSRDIENNTLTVINQKFGDNRTVGEPNPRHAEAIIKVVERAVQFAKSGKCSAICTMPISKSILKDGANFRFPGHTEYLAHLDESRNFAMMLVNRYLKSGSSNYSRPNKRCNKSI